MDRYIKVNSMNMDVMD